MQYTFYEVNCKKTTSKKMKKNSKIHKAPTI